MTVALVSQLEADKLSESTRWILTVIHPMVAVECIISDGHGLFPPPRFFWNEELRLLPPLLLGMRMAMNSIVRVEIAPPKFRVIEAEGGNVGRRGFGCSPGWRTRGFGSVAIWWMRSTPPAIVRMLSTPHFLIMDSLIRKVGSITRCTRYPADVAGRFHDEGTSGSAPMVLLRGLMPGRRR